MISVLSSSLDASRMINSASKRKKSLLYKSCTYIVLTKPFWDNIIIEKEGVEFMATTNITMRIDAGIKAQLQDLMSDLGLDMTTFFTMAAKQAIREQRIPFEISRDIPNSETIEAIEEVKMMKQNPSIGKSYTDVDEMMKELLR